MESRKLSTTILGAFLGLIVAGTVLLYAYGFANPAQATIVNAIFTATSAVCVTGLTVVHTGHELTVAGKTILIVLIQLGGLGMLTFSNWFLLSFRRRMSLKQALLTDEMFGGSYKLPPADLIFVVIRFTFAVELAGALLFFIIFTKDYSISMAAGLAVFHSISAFCNAGFTLFENSLTGYSGDVTLNLIFISLIIIGGLGFAVIGELMQYFEDRRKRKHTNLSLQTKVVLKGSALLIGAGALLIFLAEPGSPNVSFLTKALQSLFASVTARTAGFHTVDPASMTTVSLVVLILLMIVGASPGSTGGGVKTTTVAVFYALLNSTLKRREQAEVQGRTIPPETVARAISVILLYLLLVVIASVSLFLVEVGVIPHRASEGLLIEYFFETVSAASTVGLSTGVTPSLTAAGKIILSVCMFSGRVGLLLMVTSILGAPKKIRYRYPVEQIRVG